MKFSNAKLIALGIVVSVIVMALGWGKITFAQVSTMPFAIASANLYAGPGVEFGIVGTVTAGQIIPIVQQSTDGLWYRSSNGSIGPWIEASAIGNPPRPENLWPLTPIPQAPSPTVAVVQVAVVPPVDTPVPPAPTPAPDLSEIVTVGEWYSASNERKMATALIWSQRLAGEGMIAGDPNAFAVELFACVDTTIQGAIQTLGQGYSALDVAALCASTLSSAQPAAPVAIVPTEMPTATPIPVVEVPTATPQVTDGGGQPFVCTDGCATPPGQCAIKGNVNSSGEQIYHIPGSRYYDSTDIKPEEGDKWFCTVEEAEAYGFRAPLNQ